MQTSIIGIIGCSTALAVVTYLFLNVALAATPCRGVRGLARSKSRGRSGFRATEPILRLLAAHLSKLPLKKQRFRIDTKLTAAGEFGGLEPDEFIALSIVSTLAGIGAAFYFQQNTSGLLLPSACLVLGPFLPSLQLRSRGLERCKKVDRGLPAAIDLASLCMGAGLDFPGSIQQVVDNMPDRHSPVRQELERLLQELALGHTRQQALQGLHDRIDTEAVREFVAAVVQAEARGTPLSEVLAVQATALRGRRSVLAEEAAARAGVLLMLPMLMIMASIGFLLLGPLIIDMSQGGML